jgi:hypothetical protein
MPPFRVVAALGAVCGLLACGAPPSASTDAPAAPSGSPGQTGAPAADACVQARVDALTAISELVVRNARTCSVDGDCAMVDAGLPCQDNCRGAVVAANAAAFASELSRYASIVCPTLPMNCGFAPNCAGVEARCIDGTCRPAEPGRR